MAMTGKRQDYISWDEYFMGVAELSAMRSKDPNTQVGACIVSQDNKILSMGYNGFPAGCPDDEFPWEREGADPYETKYFYSTHGELRTERDPQQPAQRPDRRADVCDAVPLQRMRQGDHPERHPDDHLRR